MEIYRKLKNVTFYYNPQKIGSIGPHCIVFVGITKGKM